MTITVKKLGGSVAVVIPRAMARDMELTEGVALEISNSADTITLQRRRSRPRRSLSSIVAKINPASYRRHNRKISGDAPVGTELW